MNLSRNQKRCAYILGACALALLADRLLLAPSNAEAKDPPVPIPVELVAGPDAVPPAAAPRKPLAERFAALAEQHHVDLATLSDPFDVPWIDPGQTVDSVVDPDLRVFREAHRLNAVMQLNGVRNAIVDGRRARVGQIIDGFEIVEIRERSVVFESPTFRRIEIKLLDAGGRGGAPERSLNGQ